MTSLSPGTKAVLLLYLLMSNLFLLVSHFLFTFHTALRSSCVTKDPLCFLTSLQHASHRGQGVTTVALSYLLERCDASNRDLKIPHDARCIHVCLKGCTRHLHSGCNPAVWWLSG